MAKLHEVLAVEGELEGAYGRARTEAAKTFGTPAFFQGWEKRYQSFLDENEHDIVPTERQAMTTTVAEKLNYLLSYAGRYFDAVLQKDAANQEAKGDIIVDGKELVKDVPATTLLGMEKKMKQLREVISLIPTLPAGIKWELDEDMGKNVYRTVHDEETMKTRKGVAWVTVVEPTEHHPAQVKEKSSEDKIGKYVKTSWAGMLTSARKAEILQKVDKVARAIKQARQRANCVEAKNVTMSKALFDYITA